MVVKRDSVSRGCPHLYEIVITDAFYEGVDNLFSQTHKERIYVALSLPSCLNGTGRKQLVQTETMNMEQPKQMHLSIPDSLNAIENISHVGRSSAEHLKHKSSTLSRAAY